MEGQQRPGESSTEGIAQPGASGRRKREIRACREWGRAGQPRRQGRLGQSAPAAHCAWRADSLWHRACGDGRRVVGAHSLRDATLRARLSLIRASLSVRMRRSFWILAARSRARREQEGNGGLQEQRGGWALQTPGAQGTVCRSSCPKQPAVRCFTLSGIAATPRLPGPWRAHPSPPHPERRTDSGLRASHAAPRCLRDQTR